MGTQPLLKRAEPPIFVPRLLWTNGWMDQDATWYGSRPRRRPHSIRRGPSSPRKGHSSPLFSAHVSCGHGRPSQLLLSSCYTAIESPYTLQWASIPPQNFALARKLRIHASLGPPESTSQTASRLVQPFLQGSLSWQADSPRYSACNNRPRVRTYFCDAANNTMKHCHAKLCFLLPSVSVHR